MENPDESGQPAIQVYCTVKADELEESEAGTHCLRCQRRLTEIHPERPAPTSGCGFIRLSRAPLIASSLALASCVEPSPGPTPPPPPPPDPELQNWNRRFFRASSVRPTTGIPPRSPTTRLRFVSRGSPTSFSAPTPGNRWTSRASPSAAWPWTPGSKVEEKKFFVIPPLEP